jgi:hypothetical protein
VDKQRRKPEYLPQSKEDKMLTFRRSTTILAVSFMVLASASLPTAAAKISYEQAWEVCKAEVKRTVPSNHDSAKYSAGAACMKTHGYRLKKSST